MQKSKRQKQDTEPELLKSNLNWPPNDSEEVGKLSWRQNWSESEPITPPTVGGATIPTATGYS